MRMTARTRTFALGVAAVLAGCADLFGPSRDLQITTDRESYSASDGIVVTIRNVSDRTVSFTACSEGSPPLPQRKLDRAEIRGWSELDSWSAICPTHTMPVVVPLQPDEELRLDWGPVSHSGTLRFRVVEGERILGTSNAFEILSRPND